MDIDTAILVRSLERLFGILIGGMSIYLGYRLFMNLPDPREGQGQIKLWDLSIVLSRVGPGVFFALFGALVVGLSLYHGVSLERVEGGLAAGDAHSPSPSRTERYSGMGAAVSEVDARADARALLRRDIAGLNNLLPKLRADLPPQDRAEVELAIPRIKFALMQPQWPQDSAGWGDPRRFRAWLDANAPEPPPDEIAAAAAYFRYGTAGTQP